MMTGSVLGGCRISPSGRLEAHARLAVVAFKEARKALPLTNWAL